MVCQQILEKSTVDLLLFEAADVIKRALIIEWDELQDQDRLGLRQYLLNYVLQRHLQPYIREKILQVIAIMIKRNRYTTILPAKLKLADFFFLLNCSN